MNREIIYDLPDEEYHKLKRFSSSGIKKLLVSSQDFWYSSWMNPNKKEKQSDTFNEGKAYHSRILEGYDKFSQRYAVKPECDRRTNEGKAIYKAWKEEFPIAQEVEQETFDEINNTVKRVEQFDVFKDGRPEVTVLWEDDETGVPMKARLDYTKPGITEDLKTFSNSGGDNIEWLLARHIVNYDYHVQVATYDEAAPDHEFVFVFVQTGGPCNIIIKPFPKDLLLFSKGKEIMRRGINKFAENYRKFGTDPWSDDFGIKPFTDDSFPLHAYEA